MQSVEWSLKEPNAMGLSTVGKDGKHSSQIVLLKGFDKDAFVWSDEYLFGSYNQNLPRNISVVKEIFSGPNRLGTEEAIIEMIDFMEKHGGMGIGTDEASSATIPSSSY
ncbi:uncharacterized protein LOC123883328 [Trifolium pratense]|uniref:uncharacterized protein LOC123883328 n=1 Tax=Trifolium pratense TaxID=57577 RepID=UPI001E693383|nr:uncharacterized protein LOC123883328 [Trifolium pratense]XP_045788043.1 uncharacterized protein LOC123883328 [Trifolium pratense]XP_045788044.1 uncharacterized protein LOC123883328 [Trifolium pratense]